MFVIPTRRRKCIYWYGGMMELVVNKKRSEFGVERVKGNEGESERLQDRKAHSTYSLLKHRQHCLLTVTLLQTKKDYCI